MSVEREYLNEERYQKNKKKLSTASIIVLLIGLLIGGGLIATGIIKQKEVSDKYSEKGLAEVTEKLNAEKENLLAKKEELDQIMIIINDAKALAAQIEKERESLEKQKEMLQDPNYVINYARGKLLISQDGEQIFSLDE